MFDVPVLVVVVVTAIIQSFLYRKGRYRPQGGYATDSAPMFNPNCTGEALTVLAIGGREGRPPHVARPCLLKGRKVGNLR